MPQVFFVKKMWQNCCQSIGKDSQQVVGKERPAEAVIVSIHGTVHKPNLRLKLAREVWLCVCVCICLHLLRHSERREREPCGVCKTWCCHRLSTASCSSACLAHPLLECHHSRGTGVGGLTPTHCTHLPTLVLRFYSHYRKRFLDS